jgi:hypothetical protein
MKRSKFLAWLISLGMISSPALAIDIKGKQRKSEASPALAINIKGKQRKSGESIMLLSLGVLHEVISYLDEYEFGTNKFSVGYAVKKVREYNSEEARKERLRRKLEDIIEKSDLKRKLGKEGQVGKLLRAEMRDQNFVDFFNSVIEEKVDYELATPKILSEKVVDEMLAVTAMTDKEKNFIKGNVIFYLCPEYSLGLWGFKIFGFLKSYDFLESYKNNPLIIQDCSASTPYELVREIDSNEVAFACFSNGQLMNGDHYTQQYEIKPLKILKKVNGKLVLEDENEYTIEKNEMVKEFFENV